MAGFGRAGEQDPGRELLRTVRALGPVDLAFSATVDGDLRTFVLDCFDGARTSSLEGVVSTFGEGLGGRCIGLRRPVFVRDYARARGISHRFDAQVAGEGLRSVLAVPLIRAGQVERIVYAGMRRSIGFGERLVDQVVRAVARHRAGTAAPGPDADTLVLDAAQVQRLCSEIRAIAATSDPSRRDRVLALLDTLDPASGRACTAGGLSRRELDVLALVAVGYGNAEVAERLGLSLYTVKSYLKTAMVKLDSHTRGEAAHRARRAGLLP